MNPFPRSSALLRHQRGSVLVVCMVLAALGTIGVAAWFSLLDARAHQVEAGFTALERRVALNNSRALAHRVLYAKHLHSNEGLPVDTVYELPDRKGKATLRAFVPVPLQNDTPGLPSRNGATPRISNSTDVTVDLGDGVSEFSWTYRLRNYNPVLAGDLLSLHVPVNPTDSAPLVSGNLWIKGRAVFWDVVAADLKAGIRADEFLLPNSIAGTAGFSTSANAGTIPLNYPHYLRTTGLTSGGPAYRGELEILSAAINPQNAYESRLTLAVPVRLNGKLPKSESKGPSTKAMKDGDDALLAFIEANQPKVIAEELSKQNSLSSGVLTAAVRKANPSMTNRHFLQIFDSQTTIPDDALTEMMASLDENDLGSLLDTAIIDMNVKNGTQYNTDGKGKVQLFLDREELGPVVVESVTRLRLFGQTNGTKAAAAALLPPLLVIVDNRGGEILDNIDLYHNNSRPVIVVIASSPASPALPDVAFKGNSAFPAWRVIFDLQNTGLAFDVSGVSGGKIIGGIRGNHRISVTGGTITLERETDGTALIPLLSRDAWIEANRN